MELDVRRKQLLDLMGACPVLGGNPEQCPLHEAREMGSDEQLAWVAALTDVEVDRIFRVHASRHAVG